MITAFVYFINGLIMAYFSYKTYVSLNKKDNPFLFYFFGTTFSYFISFLLYVVLIVFSVKLNNPELVFWSDYFGRIFLYIGSAFAAQIFLYKYFPKTKKRYLFSFAILLAGLILAIYNFFNPNPAFIDSSGIVHWEASFILASGLALIFLSVWIPNSVIFIYEFLKSKMRSRKALLLGLGFLLGALGGLFQDFAATTLEYILINFMLGLGFILIFLGLFYEENK